MTKKNVIIVSALLIVGLVALVWLLEPRFGIGVRSVVDFESGQFTSCRNDMTLFTKAPLEMDKLVSIRPLGSLDSLGGHVFPVDRVYLITADQGGIGGSEEVDVFSPGDVRLTKVVYIEYREGATVVDKDYSLYFKPCREVEAAFYHMKSLSPILKAQLGGEFELDREGKIGEHFQNRLEVKTNIDLKAGDFVGKAGGTFREQAFDFRMVDERVSPIDYANSSRWDKSQQYIACPFDYYAESLKRQFMELMSNENKQRDGSSVCGRIDQDIIGTAQGAWFTEKTKKTYPEDPHLSLVHDGIESSKPVFSVGISMEKSGLTAGLYYFDTKKTGVINRDFNEVDMIGKIYCYQGLKTEWGEKVGKVVMVELVDDNTLRMESRSVLSCVGIDWAFSDRMTVFER